MSMIATALSNRAIYTQGTGLIQTIEEVIPANISTNSLIVESGDDGLVNTGHYMINNHSPSSASILDISHDIISMRQTLNGTDIVSEINLNSNGTIIINAGNTKVEIKGDGSISVIGTSIKIGTTGASQQVIAEGDMLKLIASGSTMEIISAGSNQGSPVGLLAGGGNCGAPIPATNPISFPNMTIKGSGTVTIDKIVVTPDPTKTVPSERPRVDAQT